MYGCNYSVAVFIPHSQAKLAHVFTHVSTASFCMAVSGGVMALHYEKVLEIQDECPLVLCYSASCGTGELGIYIFIATVTGFIARYTVLL